MHPFVNIALRSARRAGDFICREFEKVDLLKVELKEANDFVTRVDRQTEKFLIGELSESYPEHSFLGEESGASGPSDAEYQWVIDPLDGTTNYVRGLPHFCISIACLRKGKIEHAVIFDPIRDEAFSASRGRGAQLNGHRLRVSKTKSLNGSLIGTGLPFRQDQERYIPAYMNILAKLSSGPAGIRRAGSAALDLAYVAAGRFDAFFEQGLSRWDMAAGILLVEEAGGLVADFNGSHGYLDSGNVVCGTPKCFKALLQIVKPELGD